MPILRITKRFTETDSGGRNGIVVTDRVKFESREDAIAWVILINSNPQRYGFEIIDYDFALVMIGDGKEVLENPTGGYVGKPPPQ